MSRESSEKLKPNDSRLTTSPIRTCIVTRTEHPKDALLRFVVGPEDRLVADLTHKLPGRGIYVSCSKLLVAEALAKRLFSRAAKQQVHISEEFLERLTSMMEARVIEALSMARKGGLVISGFEKVEEALKKGEAAALIHASDAGDDGKKKLGNAASSAAPPLRGSQNPPSDVGGVEYQRIDTTLAPPTDLQEQIPLPLRGGAAEQASVPTYEFLSRDALGKVVGRDNAVHVAVLNGAAAAFFMAEARRFALFLE